MLDYETHHRLEGLEREIRRLSDRLNTIERQFPNMATQSEVDKLTADLGDVKGTLATVSADVATVATSITTVDTNLQAEINNLAKANPDLDLTALQGVAGDLSSAAPALDNAAKALEPAVEALGNIQPVKPEPEGGGGGSPAAPLKTVYTFSATNFEEPDERFTASGYETAPTDGSDPVPLFYFSGDVVATEQNGATVAGYAVYPGPVQAAPAASEASASE